jgi:hypothetical protein
VGTNNYPTESYDKPSNIIAGSKYIFSDATLKNQTRSYVPPTNHPLSLYTGIGIQSMYILYRNGVSRDNYSGHLQLAGYHLTRGSTEDALKIYLKNLHRVMTDYRANPSYHSSNESVRSVDSMWIIDNLLKNCSVQSSYSVSTGTVIAMMVESNLAGNFSCKVSAGKTIYYRVMPILAANPVHGERAVFAAIVATKPLKETIRNFDAKDYKQMPENIKAPIKVKPVPPPVLVPMPVEIRPVVGGNADDVLVADGRGQVAYEVPRPVPKPNNLPPIGELFHNEPELREVRAVVDQLKVKADMAAAGALYDSAYKVKANERKRRLRARAAADVAEANLTPVRKMHRSWGKW